MASYRRQAIGASCVWQARRAPTEGRTRWQASPRFHQVLDGRLQMGGCRSPDMACLGEMSGHKGAAYKTTALYEKPQGARPQAGARQLVAADARRRPFLTEALYFAKIGRVRLPFPGLSPGRDVNSPMMSRNQSIFRTATSVCP